MERPYVWQMIKEAVENLNGQVSYSDIKEYINSKWTDVNQDTITAQIIVLSVNHDSRIHYPAKHFNAYEQTRALNGYRVWVRGEITINNVKYNTPYFGRIVNSNF